MVETYCRNTFEINFSEVGIKSQLIIIYSPRDSCCELFVLYEAIFQQVSSR